MRFIKITNLSIIIFLCLTLNVDAQIKQTTGWAASFNSIKINEKFGVHFDFQFRSSDELASVKNILIRPGLTYQIDQNKNATIGYALILSENGPSNSLLNISNKFSTESRIWEQFIINIPIVNKVSLTNRFRLEQRFINRPTESVYSDRIRYFVRSLIPLAKQKDKFTKGVFTALQNEIFLNLSNKEQLNNHLFDQNRAFISLGYRASSKVDLELGYMRVDSKGLINNTVNNVFQVAVYTRL
jgi:hypothetical protein